MKKSIFVIMLLLAMGWQTNAQEIAKNAIGVRLSESDGFGPEVNFQRALGDANRLELGVSFHTKSNWSTVKLTGIYQWVWNIDGAFNWYAGPGAGVGAITYDYAKFNGLYYEKDEDTDIYAFATGAVGIEYSFDFPLLVSFDFRPQFNFGYREDISFDVGLSARYQF